MAARQVRRSVVMSNLRGGLLPMDSDRTPLGKGKDVLQGAARAAPLRQSVEQPWAERASATPDVRPGLFRDGLLSPRDSPSRRQLGAGVLIGYSGLRR